MATIVVRVTRDELRAVKREAKRAEITVSDLVRQRVIPGREGEGTVRGDTTAPTVRRGA
jgi:hypothetical protein